MIETRFKQTEVGLIPEDWSRYTIDYLFDIGNGYTPSKAVPSFWNNGTIPWFRLEDIRTNGRILKDSIQHITPSAVKGGRLFPAGSFIISTTATIGEHALLIADSLANQRFNFLTKKLNREKIIDTYFFLYYLFIVGQWCRNNINAGGLLAVSVEDLKNYECVIPSSLDEQRKIAEALSDIDELIASLDKLIAKKQAIKQGAMQELFTGKRRLEGFTEPWVEKRLGGIGYTYSGLSGKTKDDFGVGESKYITFLNVLNNPIIDTTLFEKVYVKKDEKQNKVLKGDLFFNTSSETPEEVGICSMLNNNIDDLYLNSFCFGYRLKDSNVNPLYLAYYFRAHIGRKLMTTLAQGVTRYNMSKSAFNDSLVYIPSTNNEQQAIASILTDMDNEISSLQKKKAKYESIKQGMMQQLLTGKIRLI